MTNFPTRLVAQWFNTCLVLLRSRVQVELLPPAFGKEKGKKKLSSRTLRKLLKEELV
jgi:hypothetical protein